MSNSTQPLRAQPSERAETTWNIFAFALLFGFFIIVGMTFWIPPKMPGDTFAMLIGVIMGWITAVVQFRWGSSVGSKDKDAAQANTIQTLVEKK